MLFEILLILVILQVGLTAGLLFIFSIAVNPGLAKLKEEEYYRAMKFINQVILNTKIMERETRFELATPCLEGRNSTAELLPLFFV